MSSVVCKQVVRMRAAEINVRSEQIMFRHQRTVAVIQYKCVNTPVILALVQFLVIIVVTSQLWELLKCYICVCIYGYYITYKYCILRNTLCKELCFVFVFITTTC